MNLPNRPTLLFPLSPLDASARPGGLPPGYIPLLWREPGRTITGEPVDLLMATVRFPAHEPDGSDEIVCGPVFIAGDVPRPVSWTDEELVHAYLSWADHRGFVPQPGGVPSPSVWDMLSSRHPFLTDVGRFSKIIAWAINVRAELLVEGKFLQFSEQAAWNVFLDSGLPGLRAHFAQAHLEADQGTAGGGKQPATAESDADTSGGSPLALAPEVRKSGERVHMVFT